MLDQGDADKSIVLAAETSLRATKNGLLAVRPVAITPFIDMSVTRFSTIICMFLAITSDYFFATFLYHVLALLGDGSIRSLLDIVHFNIGEGLRTLGRATLIAHDRHLRGRVLPTSFDRKRKRLDLSQEIHGQRRSDKGHKRQVMLRDCDEAT
ncbi:hypothetical protein PF005_g27145 [Phytophthora fragariae]|uniref:Uncharacterized protein n=1 Tax=Phytophthora fragariae TaxID=53985 RepID=A0A6A3JZA9_9STRA|nr:hypothetical protein PF009_g27934 [Phytophthora fragariae]KAE8997103.1 hypothetical protein PF011_g15621 [Phytophthora fragariae]KAE9068996.1 hypothetical protein PF010_g26833 [Phytophthora fragariae]KAE9083564.1 hypothetical protein PF006_g26666 [Phytophthora fragariae]KAE9097242.1 hypothetical protein PF007_g16697 [Phytophthora fragariae]